MGKAKHSKKQQVEKNPFESALDGLLGYSGSERARKQRAAGDMEPGEEISFAKLQEKKLELQEQEREGSRIEAGIDYLRSYTREISYIGERAANCENKEVEAQLREIMAEIKKLTDSSKELQNQFKTVAVEQHVVKPGKYHKTFFSWLLSMIRSARMRVEDSGAWLQAMHSKKKSRDYNSMAKKHGTSFTLNNERTVATQVG